MRPEEKAFRVRRIIDEIDYALPPADKHVAFTPGDLYVIREVLKQAEARWIKQAKFQHAAKLHRAILRVRHGPQGRGYETAMQLINSNLDDAKRMFGELLPPNAVGDVPTR